MILHRHTNYIVVNTGYISLQVGFYTYIGSLMYTSVL